MSGTKKVPKQRERLLRLLRAHCFDEQFCIGIAELMDTDFVTDRMVHYMLSSPDISQEGVAGEAVAILEDRYKYMQRHIDR